MGTINLYRGRRKCYSKCYYYAIDSTNVDFEELVINTSPTGSFYAEEITDPSSEASVTNGLFMSTTDTVTLKTKDVVELKENYLVKYENEIWRVKNVQEKDIKKQTELMSRKDKDTYIRLIK